MEFELNVNRNQKPKDQTWRDKTSTLFPKKKTKKTIKVSSVGSLTLKKHSHQTVAKKSINSGKPKKTIDFFLAIFQLSSFKKTSD